MFQSESSNSPTWPWTLLHAILGSRNQSGGERKEGQSMSLHREGALDKSQNTTMDLFSLILKKVTWFYFSSI